jgi:hypothetical protein
MVIIFFFQALLEFFSLYFQNNLKVLSSNFKFFFVHCKSSLEWRMVQVD